HRWPLRARARARRECVACDRANPGGLRRDQSASRRASPACALRRVRHPRTSLARAAKKLRAPVAPRAPASRWAFSSHGLSREVGRKAIVGCAHLADDDRQALGWFLDAVHRAEVRTREARGLAPWRGTVGQLNFGETPHGFLSSENPPGRFRRAPPRREGRSDALGPATARERGVLGSSSGGAHGVEPLWRPAAFWACNCGRFSGGGREPHAASSLEPGVEPMRSARDRKTAVGVRRVERRILAARAKEPFQLVECRLAARHDPSEELARCLRMLGRPEAAGQLHQLFWNRINRRSFVHGLARSNERRRVLFVSDRSRRQKRSITWVRSGDLEITQWVIWRSPTPPLAETSQRQANTEDVGCVSVA